MATAPPGGSCRRASAASRDAWRRLTVSVARAGLPLVSCTGTAFASRVSASALKAVGMPEYAAASLADYMALALKLVRDPALLAAYREKLDSGRETFPLFDAAGLCRALEAAYEKMAALSRGGQAPQAFDVDG